MARKSESAMEVSYNSIYPQDAEKSVEELLSKYDVLVFSKTTCPFCFEMKNTLSEMGVNYTVFEVDDCPTVQAGLKKFSEITTVPQLFVKGTFQADCTKMKQLQFDGQLDVLLSPFILEINKNNKPTVNRFSIFYVPEVANRNQVRLTALFLMIYSVLCVGFYDRSATPWCVLALAIDTVLRLVYGGSASALAMFAAVLTARMKPQYCAGPPKHFAMVCATFFTVFGAGLYLGRQRVGGAVVMAALAGAAGLEAFLDFCAGCWMFGLMIQFNIVPKNIYSPYLQFRASRQWTYDFNYASNEYPFVEAEHYFTEGQTEPTPVDLIRKRRLETEYKLRDFHMIRHMRVEMFSIPMTVAALAYAWKISGEGISSWDTHVPYQVLAIVSVIIGLFFLVLYLLRMAMYPTKCLKEWQHPVTGNFFAAITITCMLYGLLFLPDSNEGGGALIWIGAIGHLMLTVFKVSSLVFDRVAEDLINPSIMMAPVGNYLAAMAFCIYRVNNYMPNKGEVNYVSMARLWYGIASLFAIVLFTVTFRKAIHDHHSDNRNRPLLWVWLATSSIAGPAYYAVTGFDPAVAKDVYYQSMWGISLLFFTIHSIGWLRNFYSYIPDMSIWIMAFSTIVFAINTVQYFLIVDSNLFETLAIITMAIACAFTGVCGFHTLYWLMDMSFFKPKPKWGPISFIKLTHEAFRFAVPKHQRILDSLSATSSLAAVDKFLDSLEALLAMYDEHAKHEDVAFYPMLRRFFPHINESVEKEHHEGHALLDEMYSMIKTYRDNKHDSRMVVQLLGGLGGAYKRWGDALLLHLRDEEETMAIVARKYLGIEQSMSIVRHSYELTSIDEWRRVMPFVIQHLPMPAWKSRYVKTLLWAMPNRAHEIGLTLYHGLDSVTWQFMAQEIPEIVPRGLPGFHRIY